MTDALSMREWFALPAFIVGCFSILTACIWIGAIAVIDIGHAWRKAHPTMEFTEWKPDAVKNARTGGKIIAEPMYTTKRTTTTHTPPKKKTTTPKKRRTP